MYNGLPPLRRITRSRVFTVTMEIFLHFGMKIRTKNAKRRKIILFMRGHLIRIVGMHRSSHCAHFLPLMDDPQFSVLPSRRYTLKTHVRFHMAQTTLPFVDHFILQPFVEVR